MLVFLRLRSTATPAVSATSGTTQNKHAPSAAGSKQHSREEKSHIDHDDVTTLGDTSITPTSSVAQSTPPTAVRSTSIPPKIMVTVTETESTKSTPPPTQVLESNPPSPGIKTPPPEQSDSNVSQQVDFGHLQTMSLVHKELGRNDSSVEFKSLSSMTSHVSSNSNDSHIPLVVGTQHEKQTEDV
jgi:hypothetical protein